MLDQPATAAGLHNGAPQNGAQPADGPQDSLFADVPVPAAVEGTSTASGPQAHTPLVVRVVPDVAAVDKTFDYLVPEAWHTDGRARRLQVGSIVRIDLAGRRLRGWVVEIGVQPPEGVKLRPLAKLTGMGPPDELIDLAEWAAWRWAGRRATLLRAASPPCAVHRPARAARSRPVADDGAHGGLFDAPGEVTVLRLPPAADSAAVAAAAAARGDALVVSAGARTAQQTARRLRSMGVQVADGMPGWALAAAGATVVGTRAAVWAPMPNLAAVVVLDEHDERLKSGSGPAWHARDVAVERARRAGVATVLVSPIPSLEALALGELRTVSRNVERDGWPPILTLDRRHDDPVRGGLFAEGFKTHIGSGRVGVVLNRKGRSRLMACKQCGELVRSADGSQAMLLDDDGLVTPDGSERRPAVCAVCGSTVLRNLRIGVTRAREELAALAQEPVGELTKQSTSIPDERIVIGTDAVLWRLPAADTVVFLDFDQELLAPRQRGREQALALLAAAGSLVGGRDGRVVVQTRQPDHVVMQAAQRADPAILVDAERARRQQLRLPPYGTQVLVSGPGAVDLADTVRASETDGVSVLGPHDGAYLLRCDDHGVVLDLLARTPRPAQRVRVEVDPLRA